MWRAQLRQDGESYALQAFFHDERSAAVAYRDALEHKIKSGVGGVGGVSRIGLGRARGALQRIEKQLEMAEDGDRLPLSAYRRIHYTVPALDERIYAATIEMLVNHRGKLRLTTSDLAEVREAVMGPFA